MVWESVAGHHSIRSHASSRLMIRLNTNQIDMSVVGLQLWWKGTSPEAYIYRSLASLCIYTTSGQCVKSLATSKIHCVFASTTQSTMREESGYIKGLRFTVYVQITPSQPCVKSLVTSKGYNVYVQWQCGWSCMKRMATSKGGKGGYTQSVLQYNGDGGFLETIHTMDELVSETESEGLLDVLTIYRRERKETIQLIINSLLIAHFSSI